MNSIGIILAGGRSSRMGRDKANLRWGDRSLLQHQLELLSIVPSVHEIYVSGEREDFKAVPDLVPNQGPIEGVRSVLRRILEKKVKPDGLFVIPVDMPLLSRKCLEILLEGSARADAIKFESAELPVYFRNVERLESEIHFLWLASLAGTVKYSFKELFQKLDVCELPSPMEEVLLNTNTPEEWNDALSKANSSSRTG